MFNIYSGMYVCVSLDDCIQNRFDKESDCCVL